MLVGEDTNQGDTNQYEDTNQGEGSGVYVLEIPALIPICIRIDLYDSFILSFIMSGFRFIMQAV